MGFILMRRIEIGEGGFEVLALGLEFAEEGEVAEVLAVELGFVTAVELGVGEQRAVALATWAAALALGSWRCKSCWLMAMAISTNWVSVFQRRC